MKGCSTNLLRLFYFWWIQLTIFQVELFTKLYRCYGNTICWKPKSLNRLVVIKWFHTAHFPSTFSRHFSDNPSHFTKITPPSISVIFLYFFLSLKIVMTGFKSPKNNGNKQLVVQGKSTKIIGENDGKKYLESYRHGIILLLLYDSSQKK